MDSTQSMAGGFMRLFWMFLGPAAMFFFAYALVAGGHGWVSGPSVAILVVLFLVIAARWADPHDSLGEPTSPENLRTYTMAAIPLGLALWAAANVAATYWLAS